MGQELNDIERMYDTAAKEWTETFSNEHEKEPKDKAILRRLSQEIGYRGQVLEIVEEIDNSSL